MTSTIEQADTFRKYVANFYSRLLKKEYPRQYDRVGLRRTIDNIKEKCAGMRAFDADVQEIKSIKEEIAELLKKANEYLYSQAQKFNQTNKKSKLI